MFGKKEKKEVADTTTPVPVKSSNASGTRTAPKGLIIAAAAVGAVALVSPFVLPKVAPTETSDMANVEVSAAPSQPAPNTPTAQPSETMVDPMMLINQALTGYQTKLQSTGGVELSLITSDGQTVQMKLLPNGDYSAVTDVPTAPEWLLIDNQMYAKLGDNELKTQKAGLEAIGKPNAQWTDAAVGSDKQARLLNAGNMTNAVADLVPLMQEIVVRAGENGSQVIEGKVDPVTAGSLSEIYGLTSAGESNTSTPGAQATVAFVVDASGILTGYIVTPPNAGQTVSTSVLQFSPVTLTAPPEDQVVTLEDLSQVVTPAQPSASAMPSTSVAPMPSGAPSTAVVPPAPSTPASTNAVQPSTSATR